MCVLLECVCVIVRACVCVRACARMRERGKKLSEREVHFLSKASFKIPVYAFTVSRCDATAGEEATITLIRSFNTQLLKMLNS